MDTKYGLLTGQDISPIVEEKFGPLLTAQVHEDLLPLLDGAEAKAKAIRHSGRYTIVGQKEMRSKSSEPRRMKS